MAEILNNQHQQKAGIPKTKKQSLRIDLTPMVDLGFLLISFFIFTTTVSQPTGIKLVMPDDRNIIDSSIAPENKTLNLVLAANNKVYAYDGSDVSDIKALGSRTAMRDAITQKKNLLKNNYGTDAGMVVLIKPTIVSTYVDVVNALDEMLICDVKTYMLMDAGNDELNAGSLP